MRISNERSGHKSESQVGQCFVGKYDGSLCNEWTATEHYSVLLPSCENKHATDWHHLQNAQDSVIAGLIKSKRHNWYCGTESYNPRRLHIVLRLNSFAHLTLSAYIASLHLTLMLHVTSLHLTSLHRSASLRSISSMVNSFGGDQCILVDSVNEVK